MAKAPESGGPILLGGVGHRDDQEIERMFQRMLALDFLDNDLSLTLNFSGDVEFRVKARFTDGALRAVDHRLSRDRHLDYRER